MIQHHENLQNQVEVAAFVAQETIAIDGIFAIGGRMGLAQGFGVMGISHAPIAATNIVVGRAAYGLKKFVDK